MWFDMYLILFRCGPDVDLILARSRPDPDAMWARFRYGADRLAQDIKDMIGKDIPRY